VRVCRACTAIDTVLYRQGACNAVTLTRLHQVGGYVPYPATAHGRDCKVLLCCAIARYSIVVQMAQAKDRQVLAKATSPWRKPTSPPGRAQPADRSDRALAVA
jgi:hypothetical protein